jgi:transposase
MKTKNNTQDRGEQVSVQKANTIKLGIDVHADTYTVTRQVDGGGLQPPQKMKSERFLEWAKKQFLLAEKVYACYEAGPFGYGLYRQLQALGIECFVVCPQNWDERGKRMKNDSLDSRALTLRLDRYLAGNKDSLAIVTVPSEKEEQERSESRFREQLLRHRKRMEAQGRSQMLYYGHRIKGRWWKTNGWEKLEEKLPKFLLEMLEQLRELILVVDEKLRAKTLQLEEASKEPLPKGFGALTYVTINREIRDWNRFKNRRQVASSLGLCPGEDSSGERYQQSSINKHGNPRLRKAFIELAWRVIMFQPNYWAFQRWKNLLRNPQSKAGARKKAVVAIARHLAIDFWRMATGRTKAEHLGLIVNPI